MKPIVHLTAEDCDKLISMLFGIPKREEYIIVDVRDFLRSKMEKPEGSNNHAIFSNEPRSDDQQLQS